MSCFRAGHIQSDGHKTKASVKTVNRHLSSLKSVLKQRLKVEIDEIEICLHKSSKNCKHMNCKNMKQFPAAHLICQRCLPCVTYLGYNWINFCFVFWPGPAIAKIFVYNIVFVTLMLKTLNKRTLCLPANSSLVGILITIRDVTDIFDMASTYDQL